MLRLRLILVASLAAAIGAATGALGGKLSDFGIDDKFMKVHFITDFEGF